MLEKNLINFLLYVSVTISCIETLTSSFLNLFPVVVKIRYFKPFIIIIISPLCSISVKRVAGDLSGRISIHSSGSSR